MKKGVLILCALVLCMAAVSGGAQTAAYEPATVRVAFMPNMGSGSSLITAVEMGYFKEFGITVEMTEFQGGPAEISAMASGDIDISQIGHGAHALCIEGQAVIFGLDVLGMSDVVMGNRSKGIETVEDLKGKTIASTSGTSAEVILQLALSKAGMTVDDVNIVEMDANGAVSAMVSGNVDACATWAPSSITIQNQMGDNVITLAGNADFIDKVTFPGSFITTSKYLEGNRDVAVRFATAMLKAMDYRKPNIEEVCKWLATAVEADSELMLATKDTIEWITGDFIVEALADGTIENYYSGQQQVFIDSGRISQAVPVGDYVMMDIMKDAVELYLSVK